MTNVSAINCSPLKGNVVKNQPNFKGNNEQYVIVRKKSSDEPVTKWVGREVMTAAVFSVAWDVCQNIGSKISKNIQPVGLKKMATNIPFWAGAFLLISGAFKLVNKVFDK